MLVLVLLNLVIVGTCQLSFGPRTRYNETEARILLKMSAGAYGDHADVNDCLKFVELKRF